ncbi:peptide chain release factor N(5)-glutamine methyltransferase [Levilactobacillus bambusae]|uniref:Release factor glutamine methyltransferase n=1 Tax=Levilactobacillus bambusae TaxID=2024736 RepID=A0A2V1MZJ9_9LACO|nr:peptide chain release factor N(5)-glutamine methyltransferase [Levilactobacillus bambusae]PWF99519.1 peptide chain release factor N(5)-glutamine methyltransferase [Levilactobacillus bambusae]
MTIYQLLRSAEQRLELAGVDPSGAKLILTTMMDWNLTDLLLHYRDLVSESDAEQFRQFITRVEKGEPAQYILGTASFFGRDFGVTQATLIPRPETEELVEWILADQNVSNLTVLDVGTGSGVIATTLALERPNWQVTATDISNDALKVASENANRLGAQVTFKSGDLLAPVVGHQFDVIVSNPPYIADSERPVMDRSVLMYEPQGALFANHDGLEFYERFAQQLPEYLTTGGLFYAEIGYQQGAAVQEIFQRVVPAENITIKQDMAQHDRMVRVQLPRN